MAGIWSQPKVATGNSRKAKRQEVNMYRFLIVIEKTENNYSAYSPDLPGCVATGKTREEVERNMHQAVEMHVQGLLEDNLPIPESTAYAEYIAVPA
jgi:predicted RNase H-like HicB family nuclease